MKKKKATELKGKTITVDGKKMKVVSLAQYLRCCER